MYFTKISAILAVLLLAALVAPGIAADGNITEGLASKNVTQVLTAKNVGSVSNQTSDLEKDEATMYFNLAQRQLAGCNPSTTCDYAGIIGLYDKALALNTSMMNKTDSLLYLYQGKSYAQIKQEKYADAAATADAGLVFYPSDPLLWNNKGFALENLGKPQDALAAYDKAVSGNQNYTLGHVNRGKILNQLGRYSEAVAAFSKANETSPFDADILDMLDAAKKGEADSTRTTTIVLVVLLIAVIGIAIWYVKFRTPAEPAATEEKKKKGKSKKK